MAEQTVSPNIDFIVTGDYRFIDQEAEIKNSDIPAKVIYTGKTTIAIFEDGERIDAVPMPGDEFDEATGLAMCIARRVYGTRNAFKKEIKKAIRQGVQHEKSEYFDVAVPF